MLGIRAVDAEPPEQIGLIRAGVHTAGMCTAGFRMAAPGGERFMIALGFGASGGAAGL